MAIKAKELSGRDSLVSIASIIPASIFHNNGVVRQIDTLQELALPWMTEHLSVAPFRHANIFDVTEVEEVVSKFPAKGFLVKVCYMWSLFDIAHDDLISLTEISTNIHDKSELFFEGYIYVEDLGDPLTMDQLMQEWADTQTKKMTFLSKQLGELPTEEFIVESEQDGFVSRLRSLSYTH